MRFHFREAPACGRGASKVHPENAYAHVYLGDTNMELKDASRALFHYEKALSSLPSSDGGRIGKIISSIGKGTGLSFGDSSVH